MFTELIIFLVLGVCAGIVTGLIPGIHINLVSLLLLSASPFLLQYTDVLSLGIFIISMSITHTFLDAIPSIFLGAPDADQAMNVLPGHKLLLKGKGFEAVKLTVIGSLGALILSILLVPILIPTVRFIYPLIKDYIGIILLVIVIYMIMKDNKRSWNFIVFIMSGILGLIVLNIPNLNNPLFPMLSGLFGLSMLVKSLAEKVNIPEQKITNTIKIKKSVLAQAIGSGTLAGTLTSFFPGLGPAQGAVLASQLTRNLGNYGFMILVGGIGTVNMILSLVTLYTLDKARNGAVIVISQLLETITLTQVGIFMSCILIVGGIAAYLTLNIAKVFSKVIGLVNYQIMLLTIIIFISALVFYFSGFLGIFILLISTMIGIVPGELGVARNHSMGCLLMPVILFFLL
jgi:putative membrane protein